MNKFQYNLIAATSESTVVAEYTPETRRSESYQSEAALEREFIRMLAAQRYEYLTIHDEAALIANLRRQLEKLNNYTFTDAEWERFFKGSIASANEGIMEKTRKIQNDHVQVLRQDSGASKNIYLIDKKNIHNNFLQVINQYEEGAGAHDVRYDVTVLVNGLPMVHIELKRRGVAIREAFNQIKRYQRDSFWAASGLYEYVQIFVISNGTHTKYYSNTTRFNHIKDAKAQKAKKFKTSNSFEFTSFWADANNRIIPDLVDFTKTFFCKHTILNILTRYCVFTAENMLLVMRPYQIVATERILNRIEIANNYKKYGTVAGGGYIWHTTGSGKTMTSFKSAQLIANSNDADKVVFLTDRIELGTQSLKEYRAFADENETVQATENTYVLISKLKSIATADTLIVTSIQKMSNIRDEEGGKNARDIELIGKKRLVFIVDEAHRSTFGDMLAIIKETFPRAIFFGFTGTPVFEENAKKNNAQTDVFGNELHRYSIADGIRDKNVLGFDPYKVLTFRDKDVRQAVALEKAKATTVADALNDPAKAAVYYKYMDNTQVKMYGEPGPDGKWIKGIEDYLPKTQYLTAEHKQTVIEDIKENWLTLSHNGKFHAIFATSSIPEAIEYYRMMKITMPELKTSCLFDPNIDNNGGAIYKEDGLVEIIEDYNKRYGQDFTIPTHARFKKDLSLRLAHKEQYKRIERTPDQQLDLLIVVDQMLTGFDSKWVNTLYMDKMLEYENIIQAFSRTNRLFGPDKPFGVIRYYRKPHTMEQNVLKAVKLYSGDRPIGLFVDRLAHNLEKMNEVYGDIAELFTSAGVPDFEKLPQDRSVCAKFAKLFRELNDYMEAARVQGFTWNQSVYHCPDDAADETIDVEMLFDESAYLILAQRYKELSAEPSDPSDDGDAPYDLVGYLTEIDTGVIDSNYMNSRFDKYLKLLNQAGASGESIEQAKAELHKSFASLTQEEQKFANIFLHDIERGDATPEPGKTLRDYITEYQCRAKNDQIHRFAVVFGLDEEKLRNMMGLGLTKTNINEFGRLDELKKSVDKAKAKAYFEKKEGVKLIPPKVNQKVDSLLREFIVTGGFEV